MARDKTASSKRPKVLTNEDFIESDGYLVPRSRDAGTCLILIVHSDLYGVRPFEDDYHATEALAFAEMVLSVADEFKEVEVGLLNCTGATETIKRLPLFGIAPFAEVLIYPYDDWRHLMRDGETPDTVRLWLRGILLAAGFRTTDSTDDLSVRLAYELGQPPNHSFSDARWDDPGFRLALYNEARQSIEKLKNIWVHKNP